MVKERGVGKFDWLALISLAIVMYLFSLMPFLSKSSSLGAIFAICFVWAMAYERGLKLVWRKEGEKKMAVFIFFIPSIIGLFSFAYVLIRQ